MILKSSVLIGTDPEMFLINQSGEFVPAIGLIGGTKQQPRPINNLGDMVQEDNVAVEFNIAPTNDENVFVESMLRVITYINEEMKQHGLVTCIQPSAIFSDAALDSPAAREFGCDPDYNCWLLRTNPRPAAANQNLRSCGGHVHVGWQDPTMADRIDLARALDLFIAVPSIIYDEDTARRKLYGKAGACRWKQYGVEHRTTSNWWLKSKDTMSFVFQQTLKAVNFVASRSEIDLKDFNIIQECINTSNRGQAIYLMNTYAVH